jgi:hypothetical protein
MAEISLPLKKPLQKVLNCEGKHLVLLALVVSVNVWHHTLWGLA